MTTPIRSASPLRLVGMSFCLAAALSAQQNLVISGPHGSGTMPCQAIGTITTDTANPFTVGGSASIVCQAGAAIRLLPGFRATAGTGNPTFEAFIAPVAVTPALTSPGTGAGGPALTPQNFTLTFTDPLGAADVSGFQLSFGGTGAVPGICSLSYSGGVLGLWDNSAAQFLQTPPLQNSQCSIGNYQVTQSGNIVTLTVAITFLTSFQGAQEVYALGLSASGDYHPWVDLGVYTVTAPTVQTQIYSSPGTYTWTAPVGVTSVKVECWGPGGRGADTAIVTGYAKAGGGGGGGAYARKNSAPVTPGQAYAVVVGAGGGSTRTSFSGTLVVADYGTNGTQGTSIYQPGLGGANGLATNSVGDVTQSGDPGTNGGNPYGGAGGSGANGGPGGLGGLDYGYAGSAPGGGGGGAAGWGYLGYAYTGGGGGSGQVVLTFTGPSVVTYNITGRVTVSGAGLNGVTVALTGSQTATVTTDANGNYGLFNLLAGGNYTVTASKTGYTLSGPQTFNGLAANQTANFTAAVAVTYSITGYVTASGVGVGGVAVALTGSMTGTYVTDANGYYTFLGLLPGGNYTVAASRYGYTFSPPQSFTNLAANQTANFTATATTYTISGQVTLAGASLSGVTIALSGSQTGAVTTDGNGSYAFSNLAAGGTYTVTASKLGYTLSAPRTFTNLYTNQTANFTATTASSYTISGQVTINGAGLDGVTITLSGSAASTTTTAGNGYYSFTNLASGGNYTVVASKAGYTFSAAQSFNNLAANQVANFVETGSSVSTESANPPVTANGTPSSVPVLPSAGTPAQGAPVFAPGQDTVIDSTTIASIPGATLQGNSVLLNLSNVAISSGIRVRLRDFDYVVFNSSGDIAVNGELLSEGPRVALTSGKDIILSGVFDGRGTAGSPGGNGVTAGVGGDGGNGGNGGRQNLGIGGAGFGGNGGAGSPNNGNSGSFGAGAQNSPGNPTWAEDQTPQGCSSAGGSAGGSNGTKGASDGGRTVWRTNGVRHSAAYIPANPIGAELIGFSPPPAAGGSGGGSGCRGDYWFGTFLAGWGGGGGGGGGGGAGGSFYASATGTLTVTGIVDVRGGAGGPGGNGAPNSIYGGLGGSGGGGGAGGAGGHILLAANRVVVSGASLRADGGRGGNRGLGGGGYAPNGYNGGGGGGGRIAAIGFEVTGLTASVGADAFSQDSGTPTKAVGAFSIDMDVINQDDPRNTTGIRVDRGAVPVVYGGSQTSTSDKLLLSLAGPPLPGAVSFVWSVAGPGSTHYTPPTPSATPVGWNVGSIYPEAGILAFTITATFSGGRTTGFTRFVEVGIRTDDVIVVGWIDPELVPAWAVANIRDQIIEALPFDGNVTDNFRCNRFIANVASGQTSFAPDDEELFDPSERSYILRWMFYYGANTPASASPRTVVPGGNFLDGSGLTDETKVAGLRATAGSYKLFNRLQVKMRYLLDSATGWPVLTAGQPSFRDAPIALHGPGVTDIGSTHNPCGPLVGEWPSSFPGQAGPLNGTSTARTSNRVSSINDGSPDSGAIMAFNTLAGKDVDPQSAVFWENIGSRITFSAQTGPTASIVMQPYPTYSIFVNGSFTGTRLQAADPIEQFAPNPYPFGTVPCNGGYGVTPGGRCGNAIAPPDPSARQPEFIRW